MISARGAVRTKERVRGVRTKERVWLERTKERVRLQRTKGRIWFVLEQSAILIGIVTKHIKRIYK